MNAAAEGVLAAVALVGTVAFFAVPEPVTVPELCRPGYAASRRLPPEEYYPLARRVFAEHGVPWSERHAYQLDHRLPLCLGGSNDPGNLNPQLLAEAQRKDRLEAYACKAVCEMRISLPIARAWFDDWRASYREVFR